jgi:hypothetical protein
MQVRAGRRALRGRTRVGVCPVPYESFLRDQGGALFPAGPWRAVRKEVLSCRNGLAPIAGPSANSVAGGRVRHVVLFAGIRTGCLKRASLPRKIRALRL